MGETEGRQSRHEHGCRCNPRKQHHVTVVEVSAWKCQSSRSREDRHSQISEALPGRRFCSLSLRLLSSNDSDVPTSPRHCFAPDTGFWPERILPWPATEWSYL